MATAKDRAFYQSAATRTVQALQDFVAAVVKSPDSQWLTGLAVIAWDAEGNGLVECHHSMASGIKPGDLPGVAAQLIAEKNDMASYEAANQTVN
jgi:hypothetical protein